MQAILFSLSVTFPIFALLVAGYVLRRVGWIDDSFTQAGSRLVFNLTLPLVLFLSISQSQPDTTFNADLLMAGVLTTVAAWVLLEAVAKWCVSPKSERGIVVQGGFRSNMGIIGLAYCYGAYGELGLELAALYLAFVTILYNLLSVMTLSYSLNREAGLAGLFKGIYSNPLIVSICIALVFARMQWQLPHLLTQTAELLADMTLPLALLCTGASVTWRGLKGDSKNLFYASAAKLFGTPLLAVAIGLLFGLEGTLLGILIMMVAAPTAAASYVMVRAMGGNHGLAAGIISVTTLGSVVSVSALLASLRALALI